MNGIIALEDIATTDVQEMTNKSLVHEYRDLYHTIQTVGLPAAEKYYDRINAVVRELKARDIL